VIGVSDLGPIEERLGRAAAPGNRIRPDGFELRWHQVGIKETLSDPQLPWFTHWDIDWAQHPAAGGGTIRLDRLDVAGERDTVLAFLGEDAVRSLEALKVKWLSTSDNDGESGVVAAHFSTPAGLVRLD